MRTTTLPRLMLTVLTTACTAVSAFSAGMAADGNANTSVGASVIAAAPINPPLVNWAAPQFFNPPRGAFSADGTFGSKGVMTKAGIARTLSTFIPITPCRLVDTRNLFSPWYTSPGPFGYRESRVYRAAGACGIPAGVNRIQAVSVAVTTLPTTYSGDVEVISKAQTLGGTVLMVIQAGLWNSATTATPVDSNGDFQVQVRLADPDPVNPSTTHLAIDVNGYYAIMDAANPSDYFSIFGNYILDGGLLNVTETGLLGAAISAVAGGGAEVHLAQNGNAIDVVSGGVRARGAGINTTTFAFIHQTSASNICTDTHLTRIENFQTLGSPLGNGHAGLLLFVQQVGAGTVKPVAARYITGTPLCGSVANDGWHLYNDSISFLPGESFNIMVIQP